MCLSGYDLGGSGELVFSGMIYVGVVSVCLSGYDLGGSGEPVFVWV